MEQVLPSGSVGCATSAAVFTLRFEDGSTVDVAAHPTDGHRCFSLTEYTDPIQ